MAPTIDDASRQLAIALINDCKPDEEVRRVLVSRGVEPDDARAAVAELVALKMQAIAAAPAAPAVGVTFRRNPYENRERNVSLAQKGAGALLAAFGVAVVVFGYTAATEGDSHPFALYLGIALIVSGLGLVMRGIARRGL